MRRLGIFSLRILSLKFKDEDWLLASVAVSDVKILGVTITSHGWVSDLWVLHEHRRQGIESRLLAKGESEIAGRGHNTKSNTIAVQFYLSQGWQIAREFAHEKYHHAMLEMAKSALTASSSPGQR